MDNHFSFCEYLKRQAKILISQYIFNSPLAAAPAHSWDIAHSIYFCLLVIYLLVLSLAMFPNILGLIYSIIHLFVEQYALFDLYLVKFKTLSSSHFNWDWTTNMKHRENRYLSQPRECHKAVFTHYFFFILNIPKAFEISLMGRKTKNICY